MSKFVEQVRQLQAKVEELAEAAGACSELDENQIQDRALIRGILKLRSRRSRLFGKRLFGEPAWDILLELYDADLRGKSECISSLCHASGAPSTTALRQIHALERGGWVERKADPTDGRRFFVLLTPKAKDAMVDLFDGSDLAVAA